MNLWIYEKSTDRAVFRITHVLRLKVKSGAIVVNFEAHEYSTAAGVNLEVPARKRVEFLLKDYYFKTD